jgi:L-amino acid N-acyltransferase YncA
MAPHISVEPFTKNDWEAVRRIYAEGIATGLATFETEIPDWEQWDAKHLSCCRLAARVNGDFAGWAALSPVSSRAVYSGVAEVSIYIDERYRGRGIGLRLLSALVAESEKNLAWTLQSGIFAANAASIELHKRAGFRIVGVREKLGQLRGQWHDIVLMERRSPFVYPIPHA